MLDYVYLRCEQWPYSFFVTLASMWFHSSTYTWILQSVVLCRVMDAGLWFLDFANDKFLLLNWYHLEVPDNESGELYLADHITCHFTHLYIDFLSTKHKVFHIFCVEYIILDMVSLKSIIWTSSWLMNVSMSFHEFIHCHECWTSHARKMAWKGMCGEKLLEICVVWSNFRCLMDSVDVKRWNPFSLTL